MIRTDINIPLDQIDIYFLENRPGIDQPDYRVGKIEKDIIVYNPKTGKFMDYFYDDSLEEWFDLKLIDDRWSGYKLHRDGRCMNKSGVDYLKVCYTDNNYPKYQFYGGSCCTIHLLIGKMFIPNYDPDFTKFIDHKENNKEDYSMNSLQWIDRLSNNLKRNLPEFNGRTMYHGYLDPEYKNLKISFDKSDLKIFSDDYHKERITESIRKKVSYKGLYWKTENLDITNYLKMIGESNIDLDDPRWVLHYHGSFYVHPFGIIKFARKSNTMSIGYDRGGYFHIHTKVGDKYKDLSVDIIVAEAIVNGNKPIPSGMEVSHINANSYDNRACNLEICDHSTNMKNPITIERARKTGNRFTRPVIDESIGKIYNSVEDCAKAFGVDGSTISRWIKKGKSNLRYINKLNS